jgi:hypothetical protein
MRAHPTDRAGAAARALFVLTTLAVPVLLFGVFEGFYNHLAKDVLYFGGLPADTMTRLFPPPEYEMPNDAFFEVTGVLQIVPTVLVIKHLYRMLAVGRAGSTRAHRGARLASARNREA